jgi:ribosomal protein S18 acetylase RimI-like enzyme
LRLEILDVEKIRREEISDEDIRRICEIAAHPETLKYCPRYWDNPNFETRVKRSYEMFDERYSIEDKDNLLLIARLYGKVVGYASVYRYEMQQEKHAGAIEVTVHPEQKGKGIGLELLKTGVELAKSKGFKRLEWNVLADNEANRRLLEKGGFQPEGIRRKAINMHGELKDEALYALLLTNGNRVNIHELNVVIRDITGDDIEQVHDFLVNVQGEAESKADEQYIQAAIEKGYFKIDGKITYSYEDLKSEAKTDYLQWIVDSKGLHFGKIALLDGSIAGVLLCYTQPKNRKAFLSNIAVVRQHRRKGVGSTMMRELIKFYRKGSNIVVIELNVGFTNGIATKFYLDHNFKIVKIRDTGYTMEHALRNVPNVERYEEPN